MLHLLACVAVALGPATTVLAQESQPSQRPPPPVVRSTAPGVGTATRHATVRARVVAVNVENRMIELQDEQGGVQAVKVASSVERLKDVVPGDTVTVSYERKLTLEYQPPGTTPVEGERSSSTTRAPAGSPPAGSAATQLRGAVKVASVNVLSRVVTLQDQDGRTFEVTAGPDIDLARVAAGQQYLATYTETLAVKVTKAGPGPY